MRGYFMQNINIQGKGGIVAAPGSCADAQRESPRQLLLLPQVAPPFALASPLLGCRLQYSGWIVLLPLVRAMRTSCLCRGMLVKRDGFACDLV